jgi:hypothetical protein
MGEKTAISVIPLAAAFTAMRALNALPLDDDIVDRISEMEEEMIAGLTRLFEVGCDITPVYYLGPLSGPH